MFLLRHAAGGDSDVTVLLDSQGGDEHLAGYQDARGAYFKDLLFSFQLAKTVAAHLRQSGPKNLAAVLVPHLPQPARRVIQSVYASLSIHDDFASWAFGPPTRRSCPFRQVRP
jgi:hypothetical protein